MLEHVRALGWIGIARALLAATLGGYLLYEGPSLGQKDAAAPGDATVFFVAGCLLVTFAPVRLVQAVGALRGWSWARRFGLVLSGLDLVNLLGFPVLTGLGLYGVVVYRNAETREHFRERSRG